MTIANFYLFDLVAKWLKNRRLESQTPTVARWEDNTRINICTSVSQLNESLTGAGYESDEDKLRVLKDSLGVRRDSDFSPENEDAVSYNELADAVVGLNYIAGAGRERYMSAGIPVWKIATMLTVTGEPKDMMRRKGWQDAEVFIVLAKRGYRFLFKFINCDGVRLPGAYAGRGFMNATTVLDVVEDGDVLVVTTRNTIYRFEKVGG